MFSDVVQARRIRQEVALTSNSFVCFSYLTQVPQRILLGLEETLCYLSCGSLRPVHAYSQPLHADATEHLYLCISTISIRLFKFDTHLMHITLLPLLMIIDSFPTQNSEVVHRNM